MGWAIAPEEAVMSRILGLDVGEKRIGVALSDPTGTFASPLVVLVAVSPGLMKEIAALCRTHAADRVVIGLPLRLDGTEGPAAAKVRVFAKKLSGMLALPIDFWDERMSTVTAERCLIEGGTRRAKRKTLVDKVAAQIVLQHYLDSRPQASPAWEESDP
jgi:putative Holliday junction resolvase